MKFTIRKNELTEIANTIAGVLPKKNIKPILSGVLISNENGKITFVASDMESAIRIDSDAFDISGKGKHVVDAETLREVAKNAFSEEIAINIESNKAIAHIGKGNIKIPVINADDYPDIEFADKGEEIQLPAKITQELISDVLFCASTDEMSRNLNGVLWEFEGNYLRMVTADTYRMAVAEKRIERISTGNINIFASLKTMKMMQKLIKKDLVIRYDTKKIILKQGNITFSARLMDVNFPNYKAVLPDSFATEIKVNKKELTDAIKLISVIAKNQGDTVKIDIKNNVMVASARSADRGDGEVSIEIEHEGGDIIVAFDPAFILDVLKSLDEKEVSMKFVDAENALQMQSSDKVLYIVMPVKMRDEKVVK